jgi:UPF0755 protein
VLAWVGWREVQFILSPAAEGPKKIVVTIPKGASAPAVALLLEEKGVIRSADAFRYYVAYKKNSHQLKAGEHVLDASHSLPEVVDDVIAGRFKLLSITVPEGLTMKDIAAQRQAGLANEQDFCARPGREFIKRGLEERPGRLSFFRKPIILPGKPPLAKSSKPW